MEQSIVAGGRLSDWWDEINESRQWQDGVFYFLCAAYALVSSVALKVHTSTYLGWKMEFLNFYTSSSGSTDQDSATSA